MSDISLNMQLYNKFIVLNNITEHDFINDLNNYSYIYVPSNNIYTFKYLFLAKDATQKPFDTIIIECPENINLFTYHNLVLWFKKYHSLSIMLNKNSSKDSYYCFPEPNNIFGDSLLGYFNDRRKFVINCPNSLTNDGVINLLGVVDEILTVDELIYKHNLTAVFTFNTFDCKLFTINL